MYLNPDQEGEIPFKIPGVNLSCSTYYKVFGDLTCGAPPVVVLHGGPGAGHNYCLPFADLWRQYRLPVIFYDQIGCGASTHLPHKAGDRSFWQETLFIEELRNVLAFFNLQDRSGPGFHLLGQSWGGMLAAALAATCPTGLRRLILVGAVASVGLSIQAIRLLRQELPLETQQALDEAEHREDFESAAYNDAAIVFYKKHLCRLDPWPSDLVASLNNMTEDKTVYGTMYGPSTLTCNGTLVPYTLIPRLPKITASALVINGEYDSSHDICTTPFFELMQHVRWITFSNASHMCHMEGGGLRERVLRVIGDFLTLDK